MAPFQGSDIPFQPSFPPVYSYAPMSAQVSPPARGAFFRFAEGLYQYVLSGAYYARFRWKGKRIFERLGEEEHPCTSLPEAKRLLRSKMNGLENTDVAAARKTLKAIIKEYRQHESRRHQEE